MAIENLSEDILLVSLMEEENVSDELKAVNELVTERKDCDIIVDFFRIQAIFSVNISNLIILRHLLETNGRRLVLCNVSFVIKCIFRVTGLKDIFNFAADKSAALEFLQREAVGSA